MHCIIRKIVLNCYSIYQFNVFSAFCVFISFPSIALQMKYFTTLLFCNLFLIPLGMSSVLLSLSAYHSFKLFSFIVFPCSVQFSSVTQSCPTLCDPMNRSTPAHPVYHQLPQFTQTHVHPVSDAIQPSHPLSSPSPPAPNPSQHQSLFQ